MIFQGGILLLAVGIIQVLTAVNMINLSGVSTFFPLGIVLLNYITSLSIT
jgi:hypothetical protein